ncbi:MAG TPA: hypothetical protein VE596_01195 [Gaiellaceae bacterium]|nr:hypothetical protein [Gaiellaceae bacterium]
MRVLAALLLSPLLAVGIAYTAERVVGGPAAPQVVWGKRTFATHADFARWLRAHGRSYEVWAKRHPLPRTTSSRDDRSWADRLTSASSRVAFLGVAVAAVAAAALVILRRRRSLRRRRGVWARRALPWLGSSYARAHSGTLMAWRDHPGIAWYVAGAALVPGAALVVSSWS